MPQMPQMHPVLVIVAVLVIQTSALTVLPFVGLLAFLSRAS